MSNITRWNPLRDMMDIQQTLDRYFDDFADRRWLDTNIENRLALDVEEFDDHYRVTADLPGVNPDNINIQIHDNLLTIVAEMPEETTEKKDEESGKTLMRERRYGRFSRSIRLPGNINADDAQADFRDGTLLLSLPKSEDARVKSIPVKARS